MLGRPPSLHLSLSGRLCSDHRKRRRKVGFSLCESRQRESRVEEEVLLKIAVQLDATRRSETEKIS